MRREDVKSGGKAVRQARMTGAQLRSIGNVGKLGRVVSQASQSLSATTCITHESPSKIFLSLPGFFFSVSLALSCSFSLSLNLARTRARSLVASNASEFTADNTHVDRDNSENEGRERERR